MHDPDELKAMADELALETSECTRGGQPCCWCQAHVKVMDGEHEVWISDATVDGAGGRP